MSTFYIAVMALYALWYLVLTYRNAERGYILGILYYAASGYLGYFLAGWEPLWGVHWQGTIVGLLLCLVVVAIRPATLDDVLSSIRSRGK